MNVYDTIVGAGGIGFGVLFQLDGSHTLGRNESRSAQLSGARDYCKGHIIMYYAAVLSGCVTRIIGLVGDDAWGRDLLADLSNTGIDITQVGITSAAPTMFSVCFQYPDRSGGNITAANGASALADRMYITRCVREISINRRTIVLAAPEIPLDARLALLEHGRACNALTVGSFLSAEADAFIAGNGAALTDVLVVNLDEARAVVQDETYTNSETAMCCYNKLKQINPALRLAVTVGSGGAYLFEGEASIHIPAIPVSVVNTAGAGDAFTAGLLSGIARGMSFFEAGAFGRAAAALSVTAEDTINRTVSYAAVRELNDSKG